LSTREGDVAGVVVSDAIAGVASTAPSTQHAELPVSGELQQ